MRLCAACGRENPDDGDFCDCGEYLRWEPTGVMQAITPEALQPAPEPARTPTARMPVAPRRRRAGPPAGDPCGSRSTAAPAPAVGVEPGGRAHVIALVRNQSDIVDNYELSVLGLPDDWWSIFPDTVYLVPFGTSGTYEQEVEVHFHPPRSAEAEARIWDLQVVGRSRAHARQAAAAPVQLGIQPFEEFKTTLSPERASGRKQARYGVSIRNTANAPVTVALDAADQDNELEYTFTPPTLEIPPGQSSRSEMLVRAAAAALDRARRGEADPPLHQRGRPHAAAGGGRGRRGARRPRIAEAVPGDGSARAGRDQRRADAGAAGVQAGGAEQERRSDEAQGTRRGGRAADPADAQPGRLPPQGLAALVGDAARPAS